MPSIHDLTIPAFRRGLAILGRYLDKAADHSDAAGFASGALIDARLASDMLTFTGQIQRASDNAKSGAARLAGVEAPSFPDVETDVEGLRQRIADTDAFLAGLTPEQFEGAESRVIVLGFRSVSGTMSGETYLIQVLLPNFYFHIATAHGILRAAGVDIGKRDYIGTTDDGSGVWRLSPTA